jgi:Fic family protein
MLEFLDKRRNDYSAGSFINELFQASKMLGMLEAKIYAYQFTNIILPTLQRKEALSSMYIEGTQTTFTLTEALKNEVSPQPTDEKYNIEIRNHILALTYGAEHLRVENFSHSFMKKLHEIMMKDVIAPNLANTLGKYKIEDNRITSSTGKVVYNPPPASDTKKYMDDLLTFMNNSNDGINPLIKAAIIHSQFESIHPFSDGNGRLGRVLISLYLYKTRVISFPFFYISEAINQDKSVYYSMLTNSRNSTLDEWIKFFMEKVTVQAISHCQYIDALNNLYTKTKSSVKECINSPKFDEIIECLFMHPVLTANKLEDVLAVSHGQAVRYLHVLEEKRILLSDDRMRGKTFFFTALLTLAGNA